jgi:hypothetical protein
MFIRTSLIAAAFGLALAGVAGAQSDRDEIHRAQSGDQYDLFAPAPPAPTAPSTAFKHTQPPAASGLIGNLYMTTRAPARHDDALFDAAKGWAAEAN